MKKTKKINSYQKLKDKYEKEILGLKEDIFILVNHDSVEPERFIVTTLQWRTRFDMEKMIWQ